MPLLGKGRPLKVTNWLSMDYFSTKALAAFPANAFGNQLGGLRLCRYNQSRSAIQFSNSIGQLVDQVRFLASASI
jgi:hypothetical protein